MDHNVCCTGVTKWQSFSIEIASLLIFMCSLYFVIMGKVKFDTRAWANPFLLLQPKMESVVWKAWMIVQAKTTYRHSRIGCLTYFYFILFIIIITFFFFFAMIGYLNINCEAIILAPTNFDFPFSSKRAVALIWSQVNI